MIQTVARVWLVMTLAFLGAQARADNSVAAHTRPVPVKVVVIGKSDKTIIKGMGSVVCRRSSDLGFESYGVLAAVLVTEGQRVKAGEVLARLDQKLVDAELAVKKNQIKAAEAELKYQQAELAKKEGLFAKQALSESERNKAANETEKARLAVETAHLEVRSQEAKKDAMILQAPSEGIVTKVYMEPGEVVNGNSYKVIRLVRCKDADAEIELGEKVYGLVQRGQSVSIAVDAVPDRPFSGIVYEISDEVEPRSRTFAVKVKIGNPELILRPGMFVRAEIDASKTRDSIWIDRSAIVSSAKGLDSVYVVKDAVAMLRQVRLGAQQRNRVQILDGLRRGESVVVEGQDKLSDFSDVKVSTVDGNE